MPCGAFFVWLPFSLSKNNTTMTSNTLLARTTLSALAIALLMATTACNRDTPEDAAPTDAPAPAAVEPALAEPAAPAAAPTEAPAPDFVGTYAADDTTVDLTAHGTFAIERKGHGYKGTWTLDAEDGRTVLLDAEDPSESDHRLEVLSVDSVKLDGGLTLQRKAAGASEAPKGKSER